MDWRRGPGDHSDEADARPNRERQAPARTDRGTEVRTLLRELAAFDRPDSPVDKRAALDAEIEASFVERPDDLGVPRYHSDEADTRLDRERQAPARTDSATEVRTLLRELAAFDRPDAPVDKRAALDAEIEAAHLERLRRRESRTAADPPDELGERGDHSDEAEARPTREQQEPAPNDRTTEVRTLLREVPAFDRPDSPADKRATLDAEIEAAHLERLRREETHTAADQPDELREPGEIPRDEADYEYDTQDWDAYAPLEVLPPETEEAVHPLLVDARKQHGSEETYISQRRDFDLAGVTPEAANDMVERRAPLGMSREQFERCSAELREALHEVGITDASVWLIGSSTTFFSRNPGKMFPKDAEHLGQMLRHRERTEEQVSDALAEYERTGYGQEPRPRSQFFNFLRAMGLKPSDYDVHIYSDQLEAGMMAKYGPNPGRGPGQPKSGLDFWRHRSIRDTYPRLEQWAARWEEETGHKPSIAGWTRGKEGAVKEIGWPMVTRRGEVKG